MPYSYEAVMEWFRMVGLTVCGAPCKVGRTTIPDQDHACQLAPGHDGSHDPR